MSSTDLLIRPNTLSKKKSKTLKKGTYFIQTWGCQMNVEDSEQIALYLEQIGFKPTDNLSEAHLTILNTCSVRKKPEDKAFSMLGELAIRKRRHPDLIIGVCGCMAQIRCNEIRKRAPHVDFVIGTAQINKIGQTVENVLEERSFFSEINLPERKGAIVSDIPERQVERNAKLKSFVPIQYGCDKFCTYCIVPETRGRERSRPTVDIIDEVKKLAEYGTKEITLLGQTVNSYGKNLVEGRVPFSELLWKVAEVDGIERIRYMSPYPRDFKTDLIQTIRDCPKVMEHVHMPIQSGDNDVLKAMKRLYTVESFKDIIQELRETIPNITITTDIIVGFPGETEEQFQNTMNVVRDIEFDGSYMFKYSIREGTKAADMEQVEKSVKEDRLARLIQLQNEITLKRNLPEVGNIDEVLVEGVSAKNDKTYQGYTRGFKMVHFDAGRDLTGELVKVKLENANVWGFKAYLL